MKGVFSIVAVILTDAQSGTLCSQRLQGKGLESKKKKILSNQREPALTPEVCISQNDSSVQPGRPAEAFNPLHRKRVAYGSRPPAANVLVHSLPLRSGPAGRRRGGWGQAHTCTPLPLTGTCPLQQPLVELDPPAAGQANWLLVFVFHYFWQTQQCQLNRAERRYSL